MPECLSNEEGNKEYFFDGNGVLKSFFLNFRRRSKITAYK